MATQKDGNLSLYLRLISYLKPHWKRLMLVLVFNFFFVITNALSIWMVAPFVSNLFQSDQQNVESVEAPASETGSYNLNAWLKTQTEKIIPRGNRIETLKFLCIFIFALFFLKNFFAFLEFYVISFVEQRVIRDLRIETFNHILNLPMAFFHRYKTGELISRVTNDIDTINVAMNRSFTKLIRDPVLIIIYLIILFNISWQLTLLSLIVIPLSAVVIQNIGRSLKRKSRRVQEKLSDMTINLQETIAGVKVVKAFAMEKYEGARFGQKTQDHFSEMLRRARLRRLASPLSETVGVGVMVCVLWFGGQQVLGGQLLTSEDFIRFISLLFMMMEPIKSFGEMNHNIQIALASGKRMFQILDTPNSIQSKPGAVAKKSFEKQIQYRDVVFSYRSDSELVLRGVNLTVGKKQKVALVGSSGAGKTTLVNLLPRFYDVNSGSIEVDGIDIRDISLNSLRQLMGIVTQEVILFNDTIANNIAYGMEGFSHEQIVKAARLANAIDFIEESPKGFETLVGERGMMLSGGQRQRISIARAILKNPPILIFDEATSSLDSESEFLIQDAVENLMKDRTVLIIAHRLSSIVNADKIVIVEGGKIIDEGPHQQLLETSERYRHLYDLQFSHGLE